MGRFLIGESMAGAIEGSMEYCGRCNFGIKCSTGTGIGTGSGRGR